MNAVPSPCRCGFLSPQRHSECTALTTLRLAPADGGFDFEEFLQAELAAFAPEARLLVAAKRRAHAAERAVDVHVAGAKALKASPDRIPRIDETNEILSAATGWQIVGHS